MNKIYTVTNNFMQRALSRKVPEVTVMFWIIKLLTTAFGESLSDFLVFSINPYLAVSLGFIAFVLMLIIQFTFKKYVPLVYWFTAAMVAVFGTMAADVIHIVLGVTYIESSIFFFVSLIFVFSIWYLFERTLSIHSISTFRREVFYWLAVILTFALGTAIGDMTAASFGLGYFISGILFLILISIPFVLHKLFNANEIFMFWFAYILTRPLGASFADFIGKPKSFGGLEIGTGLLSLILLILILISILYISFSKKEEKLEGFEVN